jgi:hypothetical protein
VEGVGILRDRAREIDHHPWPDARRTAGEGEQPFTMTVKGHASQNFPSPWSFGVAHSLPAMIMSSGRSSKTRPLGRTVFSLKSAVSPRCLHPFVLQPRDLLRAIGRSSFLSLWRIDQSPRRGAAIEDSNWKRAELPVSKSMPFLVYATNGQRAGCWRAGFRYAADLLRSI